MSDLVSPGATFAFKSFPERRKVLATVRPESYATKVNAFYARLLSACLAASFCLACGAHYVARGADLYAGGRYVEAAEVFERTEHRLSASSAAERARYGLYRGATLLALGDPLRAGHWFNYARELLQADDPALNGEEHRMLARAILALGEVAPAAAPPETGTAVATRPPMPLETPAAEPDGSRR